jgi:NAD-dependent DNA ligase
MQIDNDGQPLIRTFSSARLNDRMIDELIGLCRGVLLDGAVSELEASALLRWLESNREISEHWPANVLYKRISQALEDGNLDPAEEKDLLETLVQVTGNPGQVASVKSGSSSLPLCNPPPEITFPGKIFCFTGKFVSGTRAQVQAAVTDLGAEVKKSPTQKTNYLVIGSIGSSDWIHSTHGRKIEQAVEFREAGKVIHIVAEEYWIERMGEYA